MWYDTSVSEDQTAPRVEEKNSQPLPGFEPSIIQPEDQRYKI
jgi:hypothetical protein